MKISVITPAHNEEALIGRCIESVSCSAAVTGVDYEHIVVLNRCSDRTEEIAKNAGCRVVEEEARNLSCIRNAGAKVAQNDVIVTIDADSWMSPNMLGEVRDALASGQFIGGGVRIRPERLSLGIVCSLGVVLPFFLWHRVSAGMLWCRREDYEAIGGFDETLVCAEDVDFAKRLKRHGRQARKCFGTIREAHITTSCRKFDQFGDWCFVRRPKLVLDIFRRRQAAANEFYYDCLLYTSPSPRDRTRSRMPSSA